MSEMSKMSDMANKKIVVMGGSFNPPTLAHSRLLLGAVNRIGADMGIFVPSSHNYVKRKMKKMNRPQEVLPEQVRAEMLNIMCEQDERLTVDECEFQDDGRGHTYETLVKIQQKYPNATVFGLIGADKLNIISRWRNAKKLFNEFYFAVVAREQKEPEHTILGNPHLSVYREHFVIVPEPEGVEGISSTAVRDKIKKKDESAVEMLDPRVWRMLVEKSKSWIEKDISGTIQ